MLEIGAEVTEIELNRAAKLEFITLGERYLKNHKGGASKKEKGLWRGGRSSTSSPVEGRLRDASSQIRGGSSVSARHSSPFQRPTGPITRNAAISQFWTCNSLHGRVTEEGLRQHLWRQNRGDVYLRAPLVVFVRAEQNSGVTTRRIQSHFVIPWENDATKVRVLNIGIQIGHWNIRIHRRSICLCGIKAGRDGWWVRETRCACLSLHPHTHRLEIGKPLGITRLGRLRLMRARSCAIQRARLLRRLC